MPGYVLKEGVIARGNGYYEIVDATKPKGNIIKFSKKEAKDLKDLVIKNSLFIENKTPRIKIYAAINRQTIAELDDKVYWWQGSGEIEFLLKTSSGEFIPIKFRVGDIELESYLKGKVNNKYKEDDETRKTLYNKINDLVKVQK